MATTSQTPRQRHEDQLRAAGIPTGHQPLRYRGICSECGQRRIVHPVNDPTAQMCDDCDPADAF